MIEPWLYPTLGAVGILSGFIDAVAGGGGLIMVPALLYAGLPPHVVLGTNKLQSMCGTGMAAYRYRRAGLFRIGPNKPLALATFIGAMAGSLVIQRFDAHILGLIVPVLLIAVALYTVLSRRMDDSDRQSKLGETGYLPVATGIGFYDGFFGPGAGQFYATSLVGMRGLGLTRATGLTKLMNVTSNIASVIVFGLGGQVLWLLGLSIAAGSISGAWIGSHAATRMGARVIRPLLVLVSLSLTAKLLWSRFNP